MKEKKPIKTREIGRAEREAGFRVEKLRTIIPYTIYQLKNTCREDHEKYSHLKLRLDQLALEYYERTGEHYHE